MFCRNKNNKKNEKLKYETSVVYNNKFKTDYVEIKELSDQFSQLSRFAHDINNIEKVNINNNAASFFQNSIRQAFIEEFERRIEELFGKKIAFDDYWKSKSC